MNRVIHVFLCMAFLVATFFIVLSLFREHAFDATSCFSILLFLGLSISFGYRAIYLPERRSRSTQSELGKKMVAWLRKKWNPTRDWKLDPAVQLEFDFDTLSLSGVRLGDDVTKVSFLGPALISSGEYAFETKGLVIGIDDGAIAEFTLMGYDDRNSTAFTGICKYRSKELRLDENPQEAALCNFLGTPQEREYDDSLALYYSWPSDSRLKNGAAVDVYFNNHGVVFFLTITARGEEASIDVR